MRDAALPILHHFEASPFSEKIRVVFGFKRMAWQSVLIPRILPKPDLMPLTGGYRRTPVLQIGADVYCDTQVILRAIEAHGPAPTLCPNQMQGLPWMAGLWTDRVFFPSTVNLVFGSLGDQVPQSFIDDRTKLWGRPFDVAAMTAALPHHRAQFRAQAGLIEAQLAHGGDWLLGDFSLADATAYMNVWYVRSNLPALADELLQVLPHLRAWEARIQALGHGTRADISADDALEIARTSTPAVPPASAPDPEGYRIGSRIRVTADEAVRTSVEGELVSISAQHVAIRRDDPQLGAIVVHFPRLGYVVAPI